MPNFSNLLDETVIFDPLLADSRQGVLRALSEGLAARANLDPRLVFEAVTERERLGSTGVGDGVAIPHVRIEGIGHPMGAFAKLSTPVDFDAVDDRHCDLIFMLLAPEREGSDHLRALAQVSRAFRQASFREEMRASHNSGKLASLLIREDDRGQAA